MKNLLWIPIDLPKFPIKDFYIVPTVQWHFWKFSKLTSGKRYSTGEIKENIKLKYPELVNWINLFPYKEICNIKFNIQQKIVAPHIDFTVPDFHAELYTNNKINDPCGYRVLIKGQRKDKLYIKTSRGKEYVEMPDDTDVYVLGQTNCLHGVDFDLDRQTMFLQFFIDQDKHKLLLEKSLEKYKDYAVWF